MLKYTYKQNSKVKTLKNREALESTSSIFVRMHLEKQRLFGLGISVSFKLYRLELYIDGIKWDKTFKTLIKKIKKRKYAGYEPYKFKMPNPIDRSR